MPARAVLNLMVDGSHNATIAAKPTDATESRGQLSGNTTATSKALQIAVLLGTKNGVRFLEEQLKSFLSQTHTRWSLYASNDASTDEARAVISPFANQHDLTIDVRTRPNAGFSRNFVYLAQDPAITGDLFAFSDQDDVWYNDKLERERSGAVLNHNFNSRSRRIEPEPIRELAFVFCTDVAFEG